MSMLLFPDLPPSTAPLGAGCAKPIGNRNAGRWRRTAIPRRSPVAHQIAELRRLLDDRLDAILVELRSHGSNGEMTASPDTHTASPVMISGNHRRAAPKLTFQCLAQ